MRNILVGVWMLTGVVSAAIGAQRGSPLDAPTTFSLPTALPPCGVDTALRSLARTSHVAIGLENAVDCSTVLPRVYEDSILDTTTVRRVLDRIVSIDPTYRWADMNGVVVVRPVKSWTDPSNALNVQVAPLHIENATVTHSLRALLQLPSAENMFDNRINNRPLTVDFNGGTLVDALNTLVRARQGAGWVAALIHHPRSIGDELRVSVRTFNAGRLEDGEGAVGLATSLERLVAGR
jgi:hypothetical protein